MKSKILILILALALAVSALASCTYIPTVAEDVITMIVIDADAKIEFMVTSQNQVAVATPLNDVAAILISGESFKAKKPDEAAEQFVSLAAKAGLINDGKVKFSVSGDSDYAEVIADLITKKAKKAMKKEGISGSVETFPALTEKELLTLCIEKGYILEENSYHYQYKDLVYSISTRRVNTADFASEELKLLYELYFDTYYNTVVKNETLNDITTVKDYFPDTYTAYKSALDLYKSLVDDLDEFVYDYYFDAESGYRKALTAMRDAKEALLNGNGSAEAFKAAEDNFNTIAALAKAETEIYLEKLASAYDSIDNIEKTFINQKNGDQNLEVHLRKTYNDRLTRTKTEISKVAESFNERYKDTVSAVNAELAERKQNLLK